MAIRRKQTQYDVAHGGTFNPTFVDKGIHYYQENGSNNHCDKIVNNPDFIYDDEESKMHVPNAHVCNDLEVDNDAFVHNELTVDADGHFGADVDIAVDLTVGNDTDIGQNLHVGADTCIDGNTLICGNTDICGDTTIEGDTCVCGKLDVNNVTHLNCHVTISGDLYVCGTAYEEHSTDIYVGSDFVTLRDGNNTALETNQKAGIIINKYDGEDSLGLVVDNTGTMKVGEFNTVKVYTDNDTDYYSDRDLTVPTTVPDDKTLYQIGDTDPETGLKEYYYVDKDDTEPIATRSSDMDDHQLTCWNAEGCDIHTIGTLPEKNGALLQYDVDDECYYHLESEGPGRVLEIDAETDKARWSNAAETDGQVMTFDPSTQRFDWVKKATCDGASLHTCITTGCDFVVSGSDGNYYDENANITSLKPDMTCENYINNACHKPVGVWNPVRKEIYYRWHDMFTGYGEIVRNVTYIKFENGGNTSWGGAYVCMYHDGDSETVDYDDTTLQYGCLRQPDNVCFGCVYWNPNESEKATLYWDKDSGVYRFPTMACYEAAKDIPVGSLVIIDECNDYTVSEQRS